MEKTYTLEEIANVMYAMIKYPYEHKDELNENGRRKLEDLVEFGQALIKNLEVGREKGIDLTTI